MPETRAALLAVAERQNILPDSVDALVRDHVRHIAADFSPRLAPFARAALSLAWPRLFEDIEVRHLDMVRALAGEGRRLVYLPCHRSHVDYLLFSWVLFSSGLTPPHVAAGDNLDLPIVGGVLRRLGAFFLRRSFKGDPLYGRVFAEYLHFLLRQGLPVEYFIEGGRSRTGRQLPPKTGLMGMTVHSFLRDPALPLVFVPVYIGYEKLPEGAGFVAELAGQPKQRESWGGLLAALGVLRERHGRAYLSFGAPLDLGGWLDARMPQWREAARADLNPDAPWLRTVTQGLGDEVSRRIEAAALLNPVNFVALALLAEPEARLAHSTLAQRVELLQGLLVPESRACLAAPVTGDACIAAALRANAVVRVEGAKQGGEIAASGAGALRLDYFRQNVLHHYIPAMLLARLLLECGPLPEGEIKARASQYLSAFDPRVQPADQDAMWGDLLGTFLTAGVAERREGRLHAAENGAAGWLARLTQATTELTNTGRMDADATKTTGDEAEWTNAG